MTRAMARREARKRWGGRATVAIRLNDPEGSRHVGWTTSGGRFVIAGKGATWGAAFTRADQLPIPLPRLALGTAHS